MDSSFFHLNRSPTARSHSVVGWRAAKTMIRSEISCFSQRIECHVSECIYQYLV